MLNILMYSNDAFVTLLLTKKKKKKYSGIGMVSHIDENIYTSFPNLLAGMSVCK